MVHVPFLLINRWLQLPLHIVVYINLHLLSILFQGQSCPDDLKQCQVVSSDQDDNYDAIIVNLYTNKMEI